MEAGQDSPKEESPHVEPEKAPPDPTTAPASETPQVSEVSLAVPLDLDGRGVPPVVPGAPPVSPAPPAHLNSNSR